MPTRKQNVTTTGHNLKNLLDLDEDNGLHIMLHRVAKFGIDSFLDQSEEQLMRHDHARNKGAVLRVQNHKLGLLKQLRDLKMPLMSEDSTLHVSFDYTSISKEEFDQFRLGDNQKSSTVHAFQQRPDFAASNVQHRHQSKFLTLAKSL